MIPRQDVLHGTMFTGKADGTDHVEHEARERTDEQTQAQERYCSEVQSAWSCRGAQEHWLRPCVRRGLRSFFAGHGLCEQGQKPCPTCKVVYKFGSRHGDTIGHPWWLLEAKAKFEDSRFGIPDAWGTQG